MGIYIEGFKMPEGGCRTIEIAYDADGHPMALADDGDVFDVILADDVRPVVRGKWIKTVGENGVTSACRCNECGFEDNRYSLFNFCPNCGADMREES